MTRITRDELVQIARDAGFHAPKGGHELYSPYLEHVPMNYVVERFYDAILERAAVEMEVQHTWITNIAATNIVRSLKINTGD